MDLDTYRLRLSARADELSTLAVHAGEPQDASTLALDPPLVLASAFGFESAEHAAAAFRGENDANIYGRWGNPTVAALEQKVAALEGVESVVAVASGMSAISGAVLALCGSGAHVVAPRSMYAESARLLREHLPRFGVTTTFVDATDANAYAAAIRPETRLLYIETPANPNLAVTDIGKIVALARSHDGVMTLADNTFATPFCQTPCALGVDIVVHSMTKALGGHGDAIGGAIGGKQADMDRVRQFVVKGLGGVLSPFNALLISRGLRTFPLRQQKACETAALLAQRLADHPSVEAVYHPSLERHPGHALASQQMHAFGSILSFELRGPAALEKGRKVLEAVRVISHAVSLGDVRSLIVHPASTTHSTMPKEARLAAHIGDGLLRMSVGIESAHALYRDLEAAIAGSS